MAAFLVEGLHYSGTEVVVEHLERLTGFDVFKFQPQGMVGWIKTRLTKDQVHEDILALWHQIAAAVQSEKNIIIDRANHPYILYRLRKLLGDNAVQLLMCRCSEHCRYIRRAEETRDFHLGGHDDSPRDVQVNELLLGAVPRVVNTEQVEQIPEQLKHILFGLNIENVEPHIQNNPSNI